MDYYSQKCENDLYSSEEDLLSLLPGGDADVDSRSSDSDVDLELPSSLYEGRGQPSTSQQIKQTLQMGFKESAGSQSPSLSMMVPADSPIASAGVLLGSNRLSAAELEELEAQYKSWSAEQTAQKERAIATLQRDLNLSGVEVAAASPSEGPLSAAEQERLSKNKDRALSILDQSLGSMSGNFDSARKNAKTANIAADVTAVLNVAVSAALPIAAPFIGLAARIITFGLKKYENQQIANELAALARMLPYVVDHQTAQLWMAKLEQLQLHSSINEVKQLKQLLPIPMELSAVEFVISRELKKGNAASLADMAAQTPELGRYILQVLDAEEFAKEQDALVKAGGFTGLDTI